MSLDAVDTIRSLVGDPPFLSTNKEDIVEKKVEDSVTTTVVTKNIILSDGTYGTVTSTETVGTGAQEAESQPNLRKLICGGNILLGTVACVALTKISLHIHNNESNRVKLGTLLTIAGIGKFAESRRGSRTGGHADCLERLGFCIRVLLDAQNGPYLSKLLLESGREAFQQHVASQKSVKSKAALEANKKVVSQVDDLIQFRQLRAQAVQGGIEVDLMDADDVSRAVGHDASGRDAASLKHIHQLTGYSDPVYAEASLTVHDYDIILDILIINRTPNTLTNLTL